MRLAGTITLTTAAETALLLVPATNAEPVGQAANPAHHRGPVVAGDRPGVDDDVLQPGEEHLPVTVETDVSSGIEG
jgi:hypothetical protein